MLKVGDMARVVARHGATVGLLNAVGNIVRVGAVYPGEYRLNIRVDSLDGNLLGYCQEENLELMQE